MMRRSYDILEVLPDGSLVWHAVVPSLDVARQKVQKLANQTNNECFAIHTPTCEMVARANATHKRVFQIAYTEEFCFVTAELLRQQGYQVISVIGNEPAKALLSTRRRVDLFIVGHAAPEETREQMVDWLKSNYPNVKILALNPPQPENAAKPQSTPTRI